MPVIKLLCYVRLWLPLLRYCRFVFEEVCSSLVSPVSCVRPVLSFDDLQCALDLDMKISRGLLLERAGQSFQSLVEEALVHADKRYKRVSELSEFELFSFAYSSYFGETEEERRLRLTMNFLRHEVSSYDGLMKALTGSFRLSDSQSLFVWCRFTDLIVSLFPELKPVALSGAAVRQLFYKVRSDREGLLMVSPELEGFVGLFDDLLVSQPELKSLGL